MIRALREVRVSLSCYERLEGERAGPSVCLHMDVTPVPVYSSQVHGGVSPSTRSFRQAGLRTADLVRGRGAWSVSELTSPTRPVA